jgi:type I restriction enzyme S subunit
MISDLKPYRTYRELDHTWLRSVPSHWKVRKLKYLTRFVNGLPFKPGDWRESGTPIIRIQNLNGSKDFNYTTRRNLPKDLLIQPGELLFSWSGNRGTSFGPFIWKHPFCGYLNQHIFKLVNYKLDTDYFAYMLRAVTIYIEQEKTHGIIGLVHVTKPELGSVIVPVASDDEQKSIVRFLNWANGRIDRTIRAKKRVIALLNEQKQSIINRAVTRGLDPGASLKPAGIPWIGDIPAHWRVRRAKYIYREADDRSADGSEELLSVSHITGVTPRSQKNITMFKAASYKGHKLCRSGDLVVNTMWAWMGALGVSEYTGIISPAYAVYRPLDRKEVVGEFIDGLLRSRPYISNIICRSTGLRASRLRLYPDEFFRLPLILPPAEEQHRIVDAIRLETAELTKSILRYQREIELLREYRTRLVADVVTGKLDVREAAAALPDENCNLDNVVEQASVEADEEFVEEGLDN